MTESLLIHSTSADYTVELRRPLDLRGGEYAIALKNISLWNSWHNINEKFNNNTFFYGDGKTMEQKTIPNGNYTVEDLNAYFKSADVDVTISINFAVSRFVLEVAEGCSILLSQEGKLHELLGFDPGIYMSTVTGQYLANISRGVDDLLVHCDVVSSSRYNDRDSDILYTFTPKAPPGARIDIRINEPIYQKVIHTSEIRRLRMRITDQNNQPIDVNGQMVMYVLLFKPI
jgi:hypothetical protein